MNWFECPKCGREINKELAEKGKCERCGDIVVHIGGLSKSLDLNKATKLELERIGGIGPTQAACIVRHRKTNPFAQVSELLEVRHIGKGTYEKLKDKVYVK